MRDFNDPLYIAWRKKIFVRDRYTCQMPGCTSRGWLEAHHIVRWADSVAGRYDVNNGICLCRKCHKYIKNREKQYETLFRSLIFRLGKSPMSQSMIDLLREME
jgi:hypothetical protein